MASKYDTLYRTTPHALGTPTPEIVDFFKTFGARKITVFDVGCGQGRDAIFLGRLGHKLLAIDISKHGIRDLVNTAAKENLPIEAQVADITKFKTEQQFDVVLADRTLHMLMPKTRGTVLKNLLKNVTDGGRIFIADELSNITDFRVILDEDSNHWMIEMQKRGYLCAQKKDK